MSIVTTRVSIGIDDHGAIERLADFPALQATAIARAVKRTAQWAQTRTIRVVADNLAIKQADLKSHRFGGVLVKSSASSKGAEAHVIVTGGRVPLFIFHGKPGEPVHPAGSGGSISYQIEAHGAKRSISKNAFTAQAKSGHIGIFRRGGDGRRIRIVAQSGLRKGKNISSELNLQELKGPSIPRVAANQPEFKKLLAVDAGERLELQVTREVNFILTGTSKEASDD